jgi:hypothetical protein
LQRCPNNLGRVNDAFGDEVPVFTVLGIEAKVVLSFSSILPTMTEPSSPALIAIWRACQERALDAACGQLAAG